MLKDITLGQYFPVDSPVHRLDSRTKLILSFSYLLILFLARGPAAYLLCALAVVGVTAVSRIPFRMLLKSLKPIAFLAVFTSVLNMLYTPGQVLWQWHFLRVTVEGLESAAYMASRIVMLLSLIHI